MSVGAALMAGGSGGGGGGPSGSSEVVYVPNNMVGLVIGKGGENIRVIQVCPIRSFFALLFARLFTLALCMPSDAHGCSCANPKGQRTRTWCHRAQGVFEWQPSSH